MDMKKKKHYIPNTSFGLGKGALFYHFFFTNVGEHQCSSCPLEQGIYLLVAPSIPQHSLSHSPTDHAHDVHTRKEQDMGLIYTFTDSRVRHPGAYGGQNGLFGSR